MPPESLQPACCCARKASASRAPRATIWSDGSTVGRAVIPYCRSIRMRAVAGSRVVGIGGLLAGRKGIRMQSPVDVFGMWNASPAVLRAKRSPPKPSVEGRVDRRGQQGRQLSDVAEGVEVEDGLLDGGLAVRGDGPVGQLAVLVANLGVGERILTVAPWVATLAAWVLPSLSVTRTRVVSRSSTGQLVVGPRGERRCGRSGPHVVAVDPLLWRTGR